MDRDYCSIVDKFSKNYPNVGRREKAEAAKIVLSSRSIQFCEIYLKRRAVQFYFFRMVWTEIGWQAISPPKGSRGLTDNAAQMLKCTPARLRGTLAEYVCCFAVGGKEGAQSAAQRGLVANPMCFLAPIN